MYCKSVNKYVREIKRVSVGWSQAQYFGCVISRYDKIQRRKNSSMICECGGGESSLLFYYFKTMP